MECDILPKDKQKVWREAHCPECGRYYWTTNITNAKCDYCKSNPTNRKGKVVIQGEYSWRLIIDKSPKEDKFHKDARFKLQDVKEMARQKCVPVGSIFWNEKTDEHIHVTESGYRRSKKR